MDFIPFVDVTEELNWNEPVNYTGSWTGTVVLLYKVAVIVPIVLLFRHYRSARQPQKSVREETEPSPESAEGEPVIC